MRPLLETAICVGLALTLVGTWLVLPYAVVSGSMAPTLLGPHQDWNCPQCGKRQVRSADLPAVAGRPVVCPNCGARGPTEDSLPVAAGDAVLVDRRAFAFRPPRRGDIIAFRLPAEPRKVAVKRIVGLPGETIELRGGELSVAGNVLKGWPWDRDYGLPSGRGPNVRPWRLADDEYFVVGDAPEVSDDSRTWRTGAGVKTQLIVGKPVIVHAPRRVIEFAGRRFHVPDLSAIRYIR